MAKIWILDIALFLMILGIAFSIYREGEKKGSNVAIVTQQSKQIEVQNDIISEQKKVFKRKIANSYNSIDDNLQWMRGNLCADCKN